MIVSLIGIHMYFKHNLNSLQRNTQNCMNYGGVNRQTNLGRGKKEKTNFLYLLNSKTNFVTKYFLGLYKIWIY